MVRTYATVQGNNGINKALLAHIQTPAMWHMKGTSLFPSPQPPIQQCIVSTQQGTGWLVASSAALQPKLSVNVYLQTWWVQVSGRWFMTPWAHQMGTLYLDWVWGGNSCKCRMAHNLTHCFPLPQLKAKQTGPRARVWCCLNFTLKHMLL